MSQPFSAVIQSAQEGFQEAYDDAKLNSFPSDGILRKGSDVRVNGVLEAVQAQYGSVDLENLGITGRSLSLYAVLSLKDALARLEALATATPEEIAQFESAY